MSSENLWLALTNGAALIAVYAAVQKRPPPWLVLVLVVAAGGSSFVYHLLEHGGRHNMSGYLEHTRGMDMVALWLDRAAAVPLIITVALRCLHVTRERVAMFGLLLLELVSEFGTTRRENYIVLHGLWHVTAFLFTAHVIYDYY